MAEIWTRATRQRQPTGAVGVNWANPINRGLQLAWSAASEYVGNLVTGQAAEKSVSSSFISPYQGTHIGKRNQQLFPVSAPASSGSLEALRFDRTVFTALLVARQTTAQNNAYMFARGNGSSAMAWGLGLHSGTFNYALAQVGSYSNPEASGLIRDKPTAVALTADSTTGTTYENGRFVSSGAMGTPLYEINPGSQRRVMIGGAPFIGAATSAEIYYCFFWDRVLSTSEIAAASANPAQILTPERRVSYFFPASGIPTLSAATAVSITSTTATPRVTVTF
jgi:hypothetical protein